MRCDDNVPVLSETDGIERYEHMTILRCLESNALPSWLFGVFIKTSKINDTTRDSGLSSDSLIGSNYSWKTPRVTIHDNDTPRGLINTLGGSVLRDRIR